MRLNNKLDENESQRNPKQAIIEEVKPIRDTIFIGFTGTEAVNLEGVGGGSYLGLGIKILILCLRGTDAEDFCIDAVAGCLLLTGRGVVGSPGLDIS